MDAGEVWLTAPNLRIRVGPAGVLVGRDPGCDVVVADPTASRHHALVRLTPEGPAIRALGRTPPLVNGAPIASRRLRDGDRIEVPGLELQVRVDGARPAVGWLVGRTGGPRLRVGDRLVLGGDVLPDGWPSGELVLRTVGDALVASGAAAWLRNGVAQEPGRDVVLRPGDLLGPGDAALSVDRPDDEVPPTGIDAALPDRVELLWLARGGRLTVAVGPDERVVWVPERRFALLVALLEPDAGADVADEVVLGKVWPRQPHKSRVDLNVLVGRLRGDLEAGGLSPAWVVRSEGGGGTRFRLAPGAKVAVR